MLNLVVRNQIFKTDFLKLKLGNNHILDIYFKKLEPIFILFLHTLFNFWNSSFFCLTLNLC